MVYYRIYDRLVGAEAPARRLGTGVTGSKNADITVRREALSRQLPVRWFQEFRSTQNQTVTMRCGRVGDGFLLRHRQTGNYYVDAGGGSIACTTREDISEKVFHDTLLYPILPLVFTLQGRDGLHASAVRAGGAAVAFMGRSGAGKSTLAAEFLRRGCAALTDEYLALEPRADAVYALPGLAEQSSDGESFHYCQRVRPRDANGGFLRDDSFANVCTEPLPIAAIFWLPPREQLSGDRRVRVEPLSGREAFLKLMDQSLRLDIEDGELLTRQADLFARLARERRVAALYSGDGVDLLPAAVEAVMRHCAL